jgi:hypothetical protein
MVNLTVCIFRIVSFPCLGLKMVRYHGYCGSVSLGKRKVKAKMDGCPTSWKVKDYQEARKTGQGLPASGGRIQMVCDRAIDYGK